MFKTANITKTVGKKKKNNKIVMVTILYLNATKKKV